MREDPFRAGENPANSLHWRLSFILESRIGVPAFSLFQTVSGIDPKRLQSIAK